VNLPDPQILISVKRIARTAGEAILEVYNSSDFNVEIKTDNSPLTIADRKSNDIICKGLEALDTVYPIISEENKTVPYAERTAYELYWLVDPLDGTKEFIKRNGEFTVNIALIAQDTPVAGVVYLPVGDEMYWAFKGHGAFRATKGRDERLSVDSFQMDDPNLGVVCSRSHLNNETQAFIDKLNSPHTVSRGSSLKFLALARGEAHLYPRIAPTMEWDTAAAHCILTEAGGKVLQYGTQESLRYNKQELRNPSFLATGALSQ
jgi:3'(2'), 5'-bisphosphate nucleotidase